MSLLETIFNEGNKTITESSKKLYIENIKRLNNGEEPTTLRFLTNVDKIMNKLNKYKENTKRTYIISIVSLLSSLIKVKPTEANKRLYKRYETIMNEYNKKLKEQINKTDNEKNNWISQKEIKEKYDELIEEAKQIKGRITKDDYETIINLMIISLYTLIPPRRNKDYQDMYIVRGELKDNDMDKNYLLLDKEKFIFNNYKTKGTYKSQIIEIPKELMRIIKYYLLKHPLKKNIKENTTTPFLVNYLGEKYEQTNSITRILNKIFDKNIGVSMLRKIYLTSKYGDTLEEMKEDTKEMGTSINTAQNNYIKK